MRLNKLQIPVLIHNGKMYDFHAIVLALSAECARRVNIIADNTEKYKMLAFGGYRYMDIMSNASLDELSGNLINGGLDIVPRFKESFGALLGNDADLNHFARKDVFPYEWAVARLVGEAQRTPSSRRRRTSTLSSRDPHYPPTTTSRRSGFGTALVVEPSLTTMICTSRPNCSCSRTCSGAIATPRTPLPAWSRFEASAYLERGGTAHSPMRRMRGLSISSFCGVRTCI